MTKQEFAKVVQAWADGETIEWKGSKNIGWDEDDSNEAPIWDRVLDYRIKPKDNIRVMYCVASCTDGTTWQKGRDNLKLTYSNNVLTKAEVI